MVKKPVKSAIVRKKSFDLKDLKKLKTLEIFLPVVKVSKNDKESDEELEEITKENDFSNFVDFFGSGFSVDLGGSRMRSTVLESENRSLEGEVFNAPSIADDSTKNKTPNVNPYIVENNLDYTTRVGDVDSINSTRRRKRDDMSEQVMFARRLETNEGAFIPPEARALNVGEFRREMTQQNARGTEEYQTYVASAERLQYESGLPFEQKERKRKL